MFQRLRNQLGTTVHHARDPLLLIAILVWGIVPLVALTLLLFRPGFLSDRPFVWTTGTTGWVVLAVLIFGWLLHRDVTPHGHSDETLGLICALTLGLPAMVLSSFPLVGSHLDFVHSLDPNEGSLTLKLPQRDDSSKTFFLIGIDVSQSFIADKSDVRLKEVKATIDSIFGGQDGDFSFGFSLHSGDKIQFDKFSTTYETIGHDDGRETLRRELLKKLPGELDKSSGNLPGNKTTNLIGYLDEKVCDEIEDHKKEFRHIKVILFSDWVHTALPPDVDERAAPSELKRKLRKIEDCLKDPAVSILAFRSEPGQVADSNAGQGHTEVLEYLASNLEERQWHEMELTDYVTRDPSQRQTSLAVLYSLSQSAPPLYLKFNPEPQWSSMLSAIKLPAGEESDTVFIELRSTSDSARRVRLKFAPGTAADFTLSSSQKGESRDFPRPASAQNPLKVRLENRLTERESQNELLIAIPKSSVLYRVPVVAIPVLRKDIAKTIRLSLLAIHILPLVMAYRIKRTLGLRFFKGRKPSGAGAPDGVN